jgi:hypothetical protein
MQVEGKALQFNSLKSETMDVLYLVASLFLRIEIYI